MSKLDSVNGAESRDWRSGKPVRVVRNCKGRKHSTYAPDEGNRYDGIYKVLLLSCSFYSYFLVLKFHCSLLG